jgi:hypothetical protein
MKIEYIFIKFSRLSLRKVLNKKLSFDLLKKKKQLSLALYLIPLKKSFEKKSYDLLFFFI